MKFRLSIVLITSILSFPVFGQNTGKDTIPFGTSSAKSGDHSIWETIQDTAVTLVINELMAQNSDLNYDNYGDDDDWFEIYNYGDDPILLNNVWFTDDPSVPLHWKIDTNAAIYLLPGEYFLIWADDELTEGYNHANFKLSGDGEYLGIFTTDMEVIDQVYFEAQTPNISYGRRHDAGFDWMFFVSPTPGQENNGSAGRMVLPSPVCNQPGGLYEAPLQIQLSTPVPDAEIRYTLDATDPTIRSFLYQTPFQIDSTTILKARLFREGDLEGPILSCSYFINEVNFENPVVSIVAKPDDLYGDNGLIKTNYSNVEIGAHFEYIENGQSSYASGAGIQLHSARNGNPTSLRLYARSRYGNDWFGYPFFADRAPSNFKRLILRNSGNDNVNKGSTHTNFRDLLTQEIVRKSFPNPLVAAGQPVNVFLNGDYYGILNLRERIDQFYIETHYGMTDDFDLLERAFGFPKNQNPIVGSFDTWETLMDFVDTTGDLTKQEDFEYLASQVDLENFTNYWMTEVFMGNYDWLSNNVKFWKPLTGPWQWIYWDIDHSLGFKYKDYGLTDWNTLEWSLSESDRAWDNGYNNRLIRNLMKNQEYRDYFIKYFATLLNTSFSFEATGPVLDSVRQIYEKDMIHHAARWNKNTEDWISACITVQEYLEERPGAIFHHMEEYFNLAEAVDVRLKVIPDGAGHILWEGEKILPASIEGKYFPGLTYEIDAEAIPGYQLSQWKLNGEEVELDTVTFSGPVEISAYFMQIGNPLPLEITELFYNNRQSYDCGDWIEFLHYGHEPMDLSGAQLIDGADRILYTFPEGTIIDPETYFVIVENKESFTDIFADSISVFGNLQIGFSEQLQIRLQLNDGSVAGPVAFMTDSSWPELPIEGFSLELRQPVLDPQIGASWTLSQNQFGSPGLTNNSYYNFRHPIGKDSILSNSESAWIRFNTSDEVFSDPDGHDLASIRVISIEGPGTFSIEDTPVVSNGIFPAGDLYFEPSAPFTRGSSFVYSLIDRSGAASEIYRLDFLPETEVWERIQSKWRLYPNPARDHFIIESDIAFTDPCTFFLMDITGKQVRSQQVSRGGKEMFFSLSGVDPGIYIYLLQTPVHRLYGKVEVIR